MNREQVWMAILRWRAQLEAFEISRMDYIRIIAAYSQYVVEVKA